MNRLNKRDRLAEAFNVRKLLVLILTASLFLKVMGLELTIIIDKKFFFVNVPNGTLQHEMQNQGSLDP